MFWWQLSSCPQNRDENLPLKKKQQQSEGWWLPNCQSVLPSGQETQRELPVSVSMATGGGTRIKTKHLLLMCWESSSLTCLTAAPQQHLLGQVPLYPQEEPSTINPVATEQASRDIGSNQGKKCVGSHQVSMNYKTRGHGREWGDVHVWVVRKGIPASKNKQEAREVLIWRKSFLRSTSAKALRCWLLKADTGLPTASGALGLGLLWQFWII